MSIKYWWSSDLNWFCILADSGVGKATVSLTPHEAELLAAALSKPAPVEKLEPRAENNHGRCFMAASTICENIADTEGDVGGGKSGSKYLEGVYDGAIRCATVLREKITEPPAPVASAEARLRDALEKIAGSHWERVGRCQTDVDDIPDLTAEEAMFEARKALSAHPHASDCDKQGGQ